MPSPRTLLGGAVATALVLVLMYMLSMPADPSSKAVVSSSATTVSTSSAAAPAAVTATCVQAADTAGSTGCALKALLPLAQIENNNGAFIRFIKGSVKTYNGVVIAAMINDYGLELLSHWLGSLESVGVDRHIPLIVTVDDRSYTVLKERGLTVYKADAATWSEVGWQQGVATKNDGKMLRWKSDLYYGQLMRSKMVLVDYLLRCGINVVFSDVDITFLRKNPNAIDAAISILNLTPKPADVALGLNYPADKLLEFNTGFYIARSSPSSVRLFAKILDKLRREWTESTTDDQTLVHNMLFLEGGWDQFQEHIIQLPYFQFTPGGSFTATRPNNTNEVLQIDTHYGIDVRQLARENWPIEKERIYPFTVHVNFIYPEYKSLHLKLWNLWAGKDEEFGKVLDKGEAENAQQQ